MTSPSLEPIPNPFCDVQTSPSKIWLGPSPSISALPTPDTVTLQLLVPCMVSLPECECLRQRPHGSCWSACWLQTQGPTQDLAHKAATESGGWELGLRTRWVEIQILALPLVNYGTCCKGLTFSQSLRKYLLNGTSLVAQWIRICLPMQGTLVRSLVQEDSACGGVTELACHNYRSPDA